MKQVLVQLDDETARRLDQTIPSGSRKRSEFIRTAIRKALWEMEERATAEAYRAEPDASEPAHFEAAAWDPPPAQRPRKRSR